MSLVKKLSKFQFVSENRQLLFGIILIMVIPTLVVINSIALIKAFRTTLDIEFQRRMTAIAIIVDNLVEEKIDRPESLQNTIQKIVEEDDEIVFMEIARLRNNQLVISASTNEENIGNTEESEPAFFALRKNYPITNYYAATSLNEEKYWHVYHPLEVNEELVGVLSLRLSTEKIENTIRNITWRSFVILVGIILVIFLLLFVNSRLFQYAVLYRKLRQVDQAKDDFISVASHELRTPITAIRNYFKMLNDGSYGELPKDAKESVEFMTPNVERLGSLVEDLLSVSRIQQGKIKIEKKDFNITKIINDVVRELTPNAKEKGLELYFEKSDEVIITADSDKLKQVLINIIGNSIKYTEHGSVKITLSSEKNMAWIKTKDTGIGMSPDAQDRLFEKFYRVQTEQTKNITGTGLGLWITKAIIELMGGKIYVNSIEGTGTEVSFSIPLKKKKDSKP